MIRSLTSHVRCLCVYCLCLTRRISASNPSAITLNNQSAKDIEQYFKTELNAEDSLPPKSKWAV